MRLDERGGAHILDQKGCRGRMSGICEARKKRRCRDRPSASADASHASEGFLFFLQNRVYRRHSSAGAGAGAARCNRSPRDGQAYTELITRRSGLDSLWRIPHEAIEEE